MADAAASDALSSWQWRPHPEAERTVHELLDAYLGRCPPARALAQRMLAETATRFIDWCDHLVVPMTPVTAGRLAAAGFVAAHDGKLDCHAHPDADFPTIVAGDRWAAAISVESVADIAVALSAPAPIEGEPMARMRRVLLADGPGGELWAIERHGHAGFSVPKGSLGVAGLRHLETFRARPRRFADPADGFAAARASIAAAVRDLGQDSACELFFAAERDYWQRRNRAARVQRARQDSLGLGWANHDHHTYRSSRASFATLISCLELLGMHCRERFYAGGEAGWGAQVLEQAATGVVVFADVDLAPAELFGDFAHLGLPDRHDLGTVGLWCALHGEAFLDGGMHHLEATFSYDEAVRQLRECGVPSMPPFTDYPFLRQCFTEGERWVVDHGRIDRLQGEGRITPAQAVQFRDHGAIGSHLEILERNQGFKGFNQKGVSEIIARTDPRR